MKRNTLRLIFAIAVPVLSLLWIVNSAHSQPFSSHTITQCGNLSGVISSNTTLTQGCIYIVTGNILVEDSAKLTIERGVILKFDGNYYMLIEGAIEALGDETSPIFFTSNQTAPNPGDWGYINFSVNNSHQQFFNNVVLEYSGSGLSGHNAVVNIRNSVFRYNKNTVFLVTEGGGSTTITNTRFLYSAEPDPIVVGGRNVVFTDNLIEYNGNPNNASQVIRLGCINGEIARNSIVNNVSAGLIWYVPGYDNSCIHDNSVTNNRITSGDGAVVKVWTTFRYNNLHNNDAPYLLRTGDWSDDVNVTNNYWGTTDVIEIADLIYDYSDDFTLQKAVFTPCATTPISGAPLFPTADFTAWPTFGISPLMVTFTNTSLGDYTKSLWDFGDGITNTQESPTHTYAIAGTHTVTLTTSGMAGTNTKTKIDHIVVYAPVQAAFTTSRTFGFSPLTVAFTNTSTGDHYASLWDFGDGVTSTVESPTHVYQTAEVYTVALTVRGLGGQDTLTRTDYIIVDIPVKADFTASLRQGIAPLTVCFTDTSEGSPAFWEWTFGDGEVNYAQNPIHSYTAAGVYTVGLTVQVDKGSAMLPGGTDSLTRTNYVTVYEPVQATFVAFPTFGNAPLTVVFTNTSIGDYAESLWDFGDGVTSTVTNPIHAYTIAKAYTVTLVVQGLGGSDTATRPEYIIVYKKLSIYLPLIVRSYIVP